MPTLTGHSDAYGVSVTGPDGTNVVLGDFGNMYAFAMQEAGLAEGYITQLGVAASGLVPPVINPVFPQGYIPPAISVPPAPSVNPIIWTAPAAPAVFNQSLSIAGLMPTFNTLPPVLSFPTAPASFNQIEPNTPTTNLNFTYPTLSVSLPTPPPLLSISNYTFNGVTLPTIDATIPTLQLVAPSIVPYQAPTLPYSDALMSTVQAALTDRIVSGTNTGLPVAIETNLWNRAREREMIASADAIAALEQMEGLGYAFPPGVYANARIKIQTDMGYTTAGLSRDIAIKQAELIQKTIMESIGQAIDVEKVVVDYANHVEQLAFESCKYATEAGIEIYNAGVRAYSALIEGYKAKIAYFDAQIREQQIAVEIYKTEVEAERLKAEINHIAVQEYEIMAKVAEINVDIYKAELDAIRIQADIQKITVEIFGEQIKAYVAQVNAFTAEVEAYRAGLQAVQTQEEVYKTQVQAYTALVEAAKAQIEAQVDVLKANVASNQAAWDGYKALVLSQAEQAKAIAESNTSTAEIYRSVVSGTTGYNETLTKQWQVAIDEAERVTEVGVSAAKANAELYMTTRSLALDASKVGAQVTAQLGAAAISAINWSTHYSYGNSVSASSAINANATISQQFSTVIEDITQDITST